MSYSEYGGYGYRNGDRLQAASDAVVTPEMSNAGTPGSYPGWGAVADEIGRDAFDELRRRSVSAHVVLGDGPLLVALHKQSTITIHMLRNGAFEEIDPISVGVDLPDGIVDEWGDGSLHLNTHALEESGDTARFEIEGCILEYRIVRHPQTVQHARLTQPDGTVWTGFSGYEIGEGHDEDVTQTVVWRHLQMFREPVAA